MKSWIIREVAEMKERGMKPNFSAIAAENGIDRRTVKKYYENPSPGRKKRPYMSKLTQYAGIIEEKAGIPGMTYAAIYWFLVREKGMEGVAYNTLTHYCRVRGILVRNAAATPHVRYETPPGYQVQVDWKEDLVLTSRDGTKRFEFNVYSATLGYSRKHYFIYTRTKTEQDFMRCTRMLLAEMGGATEEILTDNMSAIVSVSGEGRDGSRRKHPSVLQWEKDSGIKIRLCKPRTPQTKGKVESSNRFVNRLLAYDREVDTEEDVIRAIRTIQNESNDSVNAETGMSPESLFQAKEKQALRRLPDIGLLMTYEDGGATQKVPDTLLVELRGRQYSVPPSYIGKTVRIAREGDTIMIYCNSELVATHPFDEGKRINYRKEDYVGGLMARIGKPEADLDRLAEESLGRFGGGR